MISKIDYLKLCFKNRCYQKKAWLLSVFTKLSDDEDTRRILKDIRFAIQRDEDGFYFLQDDGSVERVEGDLSGPFCYKDERITVDEDLDPRVVEPLESTMGLLLVNRVVFYEALKHNAPYINRLMGRKDVKRIIDGVMVDNPKEGEVLPEGKCSVDDCHKVTKQFNYLMGMNNVFCKAASIQSLTVDKELLAFKAKLLEENPDAIKDPIKASWIIDQLVAKDMEIQLNGDSKDFFINKKFIDNARKRMFLAFGAEQDWNTGEYTFLHKSLDDGWDMDHLHDYVNTAISGSYDRGKATGEGGAAVKDTQRLTSRISIPEDDCKTRVFEDVQMSEDQVKLWTGMYYLAASGEIKRWLGNEKAFIGKTVKFRTPNVCGTGDGNYCKMCVGDGLAGASDAISMECSDIPTGFMLQRMKAAHQANMSVKSFTLTELFE
ncbi:RNA polymerase beta subunit [Vibrio phage Aphrodite1]|uniref:Uncharacterized protein n=1 Tax=Vibrio phage Aphrodite1 TaxID=2070057 RepID=A0A2I7QHU3_9CAUD|nr:RNA polymerase beta subunit [Vibrio phage Aphrodite1]AUR80959.1 hypothetical protein Aphrodite1_0115 [Vibrio phage Aphrodite1]